MTGAHSCNARVSGENQPQPEGLERAGFKLTFTDRPNAVISDYEKTDGVTDLAYSLGAMISRDALLTDVVWEGPAYKAGLTTQTTLVAVNGRVYSAAVLKDAITRSGKDGTPIALLVRNQDQLSNRERELSWWAALSAPGTHCRRERRVAGHSQPLGLT